MTITSTKAGPKLSVDKFRPGNTLFKVVRGNAGGSIQVLRLKPGYSLKQAASDFAQGVPSRRRPTSPAVRRVDKNVVFYGGMPVPAKGAKPNWWGVDIDKADTYFVAEPRQEHPGDAQGQGRTTSIDRCRRRRVAWA